MTRALSFATEKHRGQRDRAGANYIEHPKTVASLLTEPTEDEYIVALLHDTVEDTGATIDEIRAQFGTNVADAVECLTHMGNKVLYQGAEVPADRRRSGRDEERIRRVFSDWDLGQFDLPEMTKPTYIWTGEIVDRGGSQHERL